MIDNNEDQIRKVESFARMMDARFSIPFTPFTIGIDGLIGLIPGVGDSASFVLGLYPMIVAHRLGAGNGLKAQMLLNLLIDTVIGSIPVLGDLFDIGFKANLRNAELLRRWAGQSRID